MAIVDTSATSYGTFGSPEYYQRILARSTANTGTGTQYIDLGFVKVPLPVSKEVQEKFDTFNNIVDDFLQKTAPTEAQAGQTAPGAQRITTESDSGHWEPSGFTEPPPLTEVEGFE